MKSVGRMDDNLLRHFYHLRFDRFDRFENWDYSFILGTIPVSSER